MSQNKAPKNNVFYRNQNWHYPKIVKGSGVYLFEDNGKRYLDACSGSAVANIGHGNAEIAEYTKEHMERIAFTHLSRWTVDSIENCAEKVANWCPGDLNHVYFVSGGSESTESAMKLARQYFVERDGGSSKWKVISKWNSFHGNTLGSLSITGITGRKKIYDPMLIQFPKIPQFYHYRNPWDCKTLEETSIKAAEALELEILRQGPENVMAFISEPVVGSAAPGLHPEAIYFKMVRDICDRYDVLWIDDEVMAGFGRAGMKMAIDHYGGVTPDIICVAKGMGCGYTPIGAIVASDRIFETVMISGSGSFHHGHTYAGNPLSCGIGSKVLEIIERENYVDNSRIQGEYLKSRMTDMLDKYPIVGDVRGKGLMLGMEFVSDKATKEPFPTSKNLKGIITKHCLENGIVPYPDGGSVDGTKGDHIQITPPINITREETIELADALEKSLKATCEEVL